MVVEWCAKANCIPIITPRSAQAPATVGSTNLIKSSPSSLRCDDIPPGMALDRDEDMVAVRIDAFRIAPLQAHAFDDIEFSRPLPKEDARRLPGAGEDLGSENF